jgi:hypothetical protein
MSTTSDITRRPGDTTSFDPDGCRVAALLLALIQDGPWHQHELPEVLDTLVLLSRGHKPSAVADAISSTTGHPRGYGYIRSVRSRAVQALSGEQAAA